MNEGWYIPLLVQGKTSAYHVFMVKPQRFPSHDAGETYHIPRMKSS